MVSEKERRLLGRIARAVAGRTNAWTSVDNIPEAMGLTQSLIDEGLLEAYGENGVRLTEDGIDLIEAAASPSQRRDELEDLEKFELQERQQRRADLSSAELEQLQRLEDSIPNVQRNDSRTNDL